jgi:integrase
MGTVLLHPQAASNPSAGRVAKKSNFFAENQKLDPALRSQKGQDMAHGATGLGVRGKGMTGLSTAKAIEIVTHAHEVAGRSKATQRIDAWVLRAIGVPPGEATLADLEAVILRSDDRGTRATYAARLRSVYEILNRVKAIDNKAYLELPILSHPKRKPRPFSDEQVAQLLAELDEPSLSAIRFALLTGARAMEVAAVEGQHLLAGPYGYELQLHGKGGTKLTVPAHPTVVDIIQSRKTLGKVFNYPSANMASKSLSAAIQGVLGAGHNFHQCRHTFGTRVYRASGNDLILTSSLMRHSSINSTLVYAALSQDAPRAAVALLTA